jgi:hypothetical protein
VTAEPIPYGLAYRYLRAVFVAGSPMEASRVAAVLVNLGYAQGSIVVSASYPLLRDATGLHGRGLDRGLAWLIDRGVVTKATTGRGTRASTWALASAPERKLADYMASALRRELDAALREMSER